MKFHDSQYQKKFLKNVDFRHDKYLSDTAMALTDKQAPKTKLANNKFFTKIQQYEELKQEQERESLKVCRNVS